MLRHRVIESTSTTNEFACGDRAGILVRIYAANVHHVVDPARGFEHYGNCLRRCRTRHAQSLRWWTARCGVQRVAVYIDFHGFQRLLAGREDGTAVVGVLCTSAVAHLYRRDDVLYTAIDGRSYCSTENIRPARTYIRLLSNFCRILREEYRKLS